MIVDIEEVTLNIKRDLFGEGSSTPLNLKNSVATLQEPNPS